jgi:hypothetical protein
MSPTRDSKICTYGKKNENQGKSVALRAFGNMV